MSERSDGRLVADTVRKLAQKLVWAEVTKAILAMMVALGDIRDVMRGDAGLDGILFVAMFAGFALLWLRDAYRMHKATRIE